MTRIGNRQAIAPACISQSEALTRPRCSPRDDSHKPTKRLPYVQDDGALLQRKRMRRSVNSFLRECYLFQSISYSASPNMQPRLPHTKTPFTASNISPLSLKCVTIQTIYIATSCSQVLNSCRRYFWVMTRRVEVRPAGICLYCSQLNS